jgi:hypothetical protein
LAFGLFRVLLDSDRDLRWFTSGGFLLVHLWVALPTLGFAVLLGHRLGNDLKGLPEQGRRGMGPR